MATEIIVDNHALELLGADLEKGKKQLLGALAERGYQLLRAEIHDTAYMTGNLEQGVAAPEVDYERMQATLTVSARSGRTGSREARVFGKDGKERKTVTLRPSPAFNYAVAVARGRAAIAPRSGQALIIPVAIAPTGEGYLLVDGQVYVVRKSARATAPNPYDERAAEKLQKESGSIADGILRKFFG